MIIFEKMKKDLKNAIHKPHIKKKISLNMTFDEAMKRIAKAKPPKKKSK